MPSLSHFVVWIISIIGQLGYFGVFFVIGLEYACFPIPSEVVLPFVGMSLAQTHLNFLPAFLISILAGLIGSLACYLIGLLGGVPLLKWLTEKKSGVQKALDTFNHWFSQYGRWAVLFSRVIPLTRTYISLFAGVNQMSLFDFLLYSATGIALWNLALMSLGLYLGHNWLLIEHILSTYSAIILSIILILLSLYLLYKWRHSKKNTL